MAAVTDSERTHIQREKSRVMGPSTELSELQVEGDIVYGATPRSSSTAGILYDRRTHEVIFLRTALTLEQYVWAKQRGFKLHDRNDLVISAVHQHEAAIELLRIAFDARYIRSILLNLEKLPRTVALDWPQTALLVEGLRTTDAITFTVNPPLTEPTYE
jgi:hypothetical protein